jgi:hypothetical protein
MRCVLDVTNVKNCGTHDVPMDYKGGNHSMHVASTPYGDVQPVVFVQLGHGVILIEAAEMRT